MLVALEAPCHPLHLTFTNLEFNTQNSRWILTIKVFSDDFATNLKMAGEAESVASGRVKGSEADKALKKWLESRFLIWFDSKPVPPDTWKFDGIRVKEDASWLMYTFTAPLPISEIKIRNTLLLDLYPDQKNLFVLVMGQTQSSHEFKNKDRETIIRLNK